MTAIILPKPDIVKGFIIIIHILITPLRFCKDPFLKGFFHLVLLLSCKHRFLLIDLIMVSAISILNAVTHGYGSEIQRCLKDRIGIHTGSTIGFTGSHRGFVI